MVYAPPLRKFSVEFTEKVTSGARPGTLAIVALPDAPGSFSQRDHVSVLAFAKPTLPSKTSVPSRKILRMPIPHFR
jgi:hypothetical protein